MKAKKRDKTEGKIQEKKRLIFDKKPAGCCTHLTGKKKIKIVGISE